MSEFQLTPEGTSQQHQDRLYVSSETRKLTLPPAGLPLLHSGSLKEIEVKYETYGSLNAQKANAVLICTPLSMDHHAAGWYSDQDEKPGWWDEMIGPGKAIDTNIYYVIASNMLGGCRGTTGPSSLNPDTQKPYGKDFPRITVEDIVQVQALLIEQLGIPYLAAVIGGSLGGMQALQWSVAYPDKVKKCICIAAAPHLSPQALGFEIVGRKALLNDKNFGSGDFYDKPETPDEGLALARMIGLLTYLSADSMESKFSRTRKDEYDANCFETGYDVENYLTHNSQKFVSRFDANSYLHITYALDTFDLEESHGSLANAFEKSRAEFLLVALSSDWLFPPSQSRHLCRELLNLGKIASLVELDSPYGHDAFLLEVENLSKLIGAFLERNEVGPPTSPKMRSTSTVENQTGSHRVFDPSMDYGLVGNLVEPGSHILDIGCGDGELIDNLYLSKQVTGFGIDIDLENVIKCLTRDVPVVHGDVNKVFNLFGYNSFDYAVLSQTIQMLRRPGFILKEMLRVAKKSIIVFPNFGHFRNRLTLGLKGTMPIADAVDFKWWENPDIHQFSFKDFQKLCAVENIMIEKVLPIGQSALSRSMIRMGMVNTGADVIVVRLGSKH
ncbi:MAG: homoserine O-acetyltransferase [Fibrobacteria bacterium]|nr:homoserine O-acetyltransferase [Fibrobacteria bacterium]